MSGNQKIPKARQKDVNAKAFHDLQQAEAKYRSTFENAIEGIFQSTPEGRYLSVNPAMARLYGYDSPEEMIAAVTDIAHQVYADPEMRGEFARRLKKEGKVERFELRALRKDGSLIWTSTNARIVRDAQGRVQYYEGFIQDITERKRAEEALRESEERYRTFIDSTADSVFVKDNEFRYVLVNKACQEFFGKPEVEIVGKSDFDLMPQQVAETCLRTDRLALEQNGVVITDEPVDDRIYETRKFPVRLKDGKTGVGGLIRDITERKQAEEEIQRMALMLDAAPNSITVHNFDGRFLYANQRTFDLHGFTRDEFLALNLHQLDVPASEKLIAPRMQELLDRGEATFEVAHYRKDGTILPLEIFARVTTWGDKKVILSIATNLTERKQVEEALRKKDEHHSNVVESIFRFVPEGLLVFTENLSLVKQNKAFEEITQQYAARLGYAEQELAELIAEQVRRKILSGDTTEIHIPKKRC